MSRKSNTAILIFSAVLFNTATFFAVFFAMFSLFFFFSKKILSDEGLTSIMTPIIIMLFIAAMGLSFVIYRLVLAFFLSKVDMDEHFESILWNKKRPPPRADAPKE